MKRRIKIIPTIIATLFFLAIIAVVVVVMMYFNGINSVSKNSVEVSFTVNENETFSTLADDLKKSDLIKSELFYKVYIKLNKPTHLKRGTYTLNKNMDVKKIVSILSDGSKYLETNKITFKEGKNLRTYIKQISQATGIKEEDIIAKLKDTAYLDKLITKYWFLKSDIKNTNLYYSLEGYLYPDTYEFKKDANIEEIIETMLDNTDSKLKKYETNLLNNKYTIHELITLASIVELESVGNDRAGVAGVFFNRLNAGQTLGSDVTTYYGAKIDIGERDLYQAELNSVNGYNTRVSSMAGKLPIGPICNPSVLSIEAVLNPTKSNYFYFVADKNKKVYFTRTYNEHLAIIQKLKSEGLWYTYNN